MSASPAPFDTPVPAELLAGCLRQDRAAQERLYRLFERPVYSLLRRMTGCPDQAWDLTQDCFLQAFERLAQFRGDAPFGRWLRSIAATQALMHLRSQRRWSELFSPESIEDERVPAVDQLAQSDLEQALAVLQPLPRTVLWLYHVEGYTHVEIAELAGRTVSFSKSQLSRAHHKLRQLFADAAPDAASASETPDSRRGRLLEARP